jgi:N6-L-threonylcarbamoyladenine synthase
MWLRPVLSHGFSRVQLLCQPLQNSRRRLMTIAIETSCDDTSVAILEKTTEHGRHIARLHFHKKVTSNNAEYLGVHPLVSLRSHQENLANLVYEAIGHLPPQKTSHVVIDQGELEGKVHDDAELVTNRRLPDFISVTRGPGMRSNLFTGLDTAKGLAVAWQVCFYIV